MLNVAYHLTATLPMIELVGSFQEQEVRLIQARIAIPAEGGYAELVRVGVPRANGRST